jgi:hypothetical protein
MAQKGMRPSAMIKQRLKGTPVAMPTKKSSSLTVAEMNKIREFAKKYNASKKKKGLNDFLKEGKRPPSKNKKLPSDADVIIKGYNDKKTLNRKKK